MLEVNKSTKYFYFLIFLISCYNEKKEAQNFTVKESPNKYYSFNREKTERHYLATDINEIAENTAILKLYGDTIVNGFLNKYKKLPNLHEIYFNNCCFTRINPILKEISNHSSLYLLVFEDCEIDSITSEIQNMKSLKEIQINQDNPQLFIHSGLFSLTNLEKISLSFIKNGQKLQKYFHKFKHLKELQLRYCGIKTLDTSLLHHPTLTKLELMENDLVNIPRMEKINPRLLELNINKTPMGIRISNNRNLFFNSIEYHIFKEYFPNCNLIYNNILRIQ